jgi:hypothetical protein
LIASGSREKPLAVGEKMTNTTSTKLSLKDLLCRAGYTTITIKFRLPGGGTYTLVIDLNCTPPVDTTPPTAPTVLSLGGSYGYDMPDAITAELQYNEPIAVVESFVLPT